MSTIQITGVTKHFGPTRVLRGIDLSVAQGEFVSLLGPSGCGKTTLLRCLAGLESIGGGEIKIDGKVVSGPNQMIPPEDRNVGMIFQSYALWPHMTVEANIAYGLKLRKIAAAEIGQRVKESLAMVGLEGYHKRYPAQLSGGQQQRVALARSVAMRPKVLLFDEPLSNLDAQLRERMRGELRDLQQLLGTTAVYVTHDQDEAMAISDRIVLMREGQIIQQGPPAQMYAAPATAYAASFLGSVNFIPARAEGGGVTAQGSIRLECAVNSQEKQILLGIRHEDLLVGPAAGGPNTFDAVVEKVVFMGATWHLDLRLGALNLRAVVPFRTLADGVPARVPLSLPPAHLLYIPVDDLGVMTEEGSGLEVAGV